MVILLKYGASFPLLPSTLEKNDEEKKECFCHLRHDKENYKDDKSLSMIALSMAPKMAKIYHHFCP